MLLIFKQRILLHIENSKESQQTGGVPAELGPSGCSQVPAEQTHAPRMELNCGGSHLPSATALLLTGSVSSLRGSGLIEPDTFPGSLPRSLGWSTFYPVLGPLKKVPRGSWVILLTKELMNIKKGFDFIIKDKDCQIKQCM